MLISTPLLALFLAAVLIFVVILFWHRWSVGVLSRHYEESVYRTERALAQSLTTTSAQAEWIDVQDRKIKEQFSAIAGVLKERDVWKNWYNESSFLYGNAQHMLMGELERVALAARVQVSPKIRALQATIAEKAQMVQATVPGMVTPASPEPLPERPDALKGKNDEIEKEDVTPSEVPPVNRLA